MVASWRDVVLGDAVTLQRGFDLPIQDRKPGAIPIISSSGISGAHSEAQAKGPGVVTGRYGTIGKVFFITHDFWPLNTTLFVKDFKGNDPRFVSYLLQTVDFHSCSDKSSVPGVNRNDLHLLKIRIPSAAEQRAIARILGTFDDKIELNRRMNETLEAMARALFKSWFVDFDPVRAKAAGQAPPGLAPEIASLFPDRFQDSELGEIPEGWTVRSLDEIARFLNGLALQKYPPVGDRFLPVIKISQLRAGNTNNSDRATLDLEADYVVKDGDILFSWSGSLECVLWSGGPGALNQHLFKVTSDTYPRWLCYLGIHRHLSDFRDIAASKATTMGHIQRHHLADAKLAIPSQTLLGAMDPFIGPILESTWRRAVQSRTLAAQRDLLLPKLISGELGVPDVLLTTGTLA